MARRNVIHLSSVKPNRFGGTTTGTLCCRFCLGDDGMNLTTIEAAVTCKLCLAAIRKAAIRAANLLGGGDG